MTNKLFYRVLFIWVNSRIRVSEPLLGSENWDFGRKKIKIDIWVFWVKRLMVISKQETAILGFLFEERKDNETVMVLF